MKLLLVDDHRWLGPALTGLLKQWGEDWEQQLDLSFETDAESGLKGAGSREFDLILLDMGLPGISGVEALAAMREAYASAAIVVFSADENPQLVRQAIEAGAMGYIPKSSSPEVLKSALRLVLDGGVYVPPIALAASGTAAAIRDKATNPVELSERQMQVLAAVIKGRPNKVIARELGISEHTVKSHLSAVFRALGVHNRTEAVFAAAKLGIRSG